MDKARVFLTTNARDEIRLGFALATIAYWARHREVDLIVQDAGADPVLWRWLLQRGFTPVVHGLVAEGSQRGRHTHAWAVAGEYDYWVVDDDILPRPEFSPWEAQALAARFPQFGMVALALPNCPLYHGPALASAVDPVAEAGAVGGARLMRGELALTFPELDSTIPGYDTLLANAVRAAGARVGYFSEAAPRTLRATHLGETVSVVWPQLEIPREFPRG